MLPASFEHAGYRARLHARRRAAAEEEEDWNNWEEESRWSAKVRVDVCICDGSVGHTQSFMITLLAQHT